MAEVSRKEQKYIVTQMQYCQIRSALLPFTVPDTHQALWGYTVRSLYFDTPYDKDFCDKEDGLDERRKIRLRIYSPWDETAKLEIKQKNGENQKKFSITITKEEALQLIAGKADFLLSRREVLCPWLYYLFKAQLLRPKCIVEYKREAFCGLINDTRITFDRDIYASESNFQLFNPELPLYPVSPPGEITMEVKFNGFLTDDIKEAVSVSDESRVSYSKYMRARMITKGESA